MADNLQYRRRRPDDNLRQRQPHRQHHRQIPDLQRHNARRNLGYAAANQYGSSTFKYKYSLESTVTVTTKKVDKVRELLGRQAELLKEGVAFSNSYINYRYTDLNAIKPAMIEEATKNARLAADKFAADSHSKVGKIKTASQGQFTIDDSDSSTPWLKNVRVVSTIVYYIED